MQRLVVAAPVRLAALRVTTRGHLWWSREDSVEAARDLAHHGCRIRLWMRAGTAHILRDMDAETRAAFARIDHWFELSQAQHLELRQQMDSQHQDLRQEIGDLRQQVGSLGQQVGSLGQEVGSLRQEVGSLRQQISRVEASLDALWAEFRTFRDWVTAQFAELRRGSNSPFGSNG